MQIVVQKNQRQFQVLEVMHSRPGGTQFGVGNLFDEDGLAQSGLFCGRELLLAFDVPNQESGFMGISGKYTGRFGDYNFGEHNEFDNLHGKGISISENCIAIGYYNDGYLAPGNYLKISSGGEFKVGECYLKDGYKFFRGTRYYKNGATGKYDN